MKKRKSNYGVSSRVDSYLKTYKKFRELEPLAAKARKYESATEFEIELKQGYLQPIDILKNELRKYQKDLENAKRLLSTAESEISKRDAKRSIKSSNKKIKELTKAIEGHSSIEKIKNAGYSISDFYSQATKGVEVKPEPKPKEITDYEKLSGLGKQIYRLAVLSKTNEEFLNNLKTIKITLETAKKEIEEIGQSLRNLEVK